LFVHVASAEQLSVFSVHSSMSTHDLVRMSIFDPAAQVFPHVHRADLPGLVPAWPDMPYLQHWSAWLPQQPV
jgi:hypothetical protein